MARTRQLATVIVACGLSLLACRQANRTLVTTPDLAETTPTSVVSPGGIVHSDEPAVVGTTLPTPLPRFAPYVDQGQVPRIDLAETLRTTGVEQFSLAFVQAAGGCRPAWAGHGLDSDLATTIARDANSVRALGGSVIVAFGGAAGQELAAACSTGDALLAQYAAVVDRYAATSIDFDIEGAGAADPVATDRRSSAIAALQSMHPAIEVSFTLEAGARGLNKNGVAVLRSALAHGVRITRVNLMTMYFGTPGEPMMSLIVAAATAAQPQLAELFPRHSDDDLRRLIGVVPLIGKNQVIDESFTPADARELRAWATESRLGMLSMWSIDLDRQCDSPHSRATSRCSGVDQEPLEFSRILAGRCVQPQPIASPVAPCAERAK